MRGEVVTMTAAGESVSEAHQKCPFCAARKILPAGPRAKRHGEHAGGRPKPLSRPEGSARVSPLRIDISRRPRYVG